MEEEKEEGYGKRPLWQWIALYVVVGVAIYGLVYYFVLAKNNNSYTASTRVSPTKTMQNSTTASNKLVKIAVLGTDFAFTPSTITLYKGQPAQVVFTNNGQFRHNLSIPDLKVTTKTIPSGETDAITFTPTKTGQFSFLCTVPGCADKGMTGTLTVK